MVTGRLPRRTRLAALTKTMWGCLPGPGRTTNIRRASCVTGRAASVIYLPGGTRHTSEWVVYDSASWCWHRRIFIPAIAIEVDKGDIARALAGEPRAACLAEPIRAAPVNPRALAVVCPAVLLGIALRLPAGQDEIRIPVPVGVAGRGRERAMDGEDDG